MEAPGARVNSLRVFREGVGMTGPEVLLGDSGQEGGQGCCGGR